MTIDYVVKKKAIDLHLQGRGRNEIARILNSQKMRISEATITHLIQDWKRQQQQQEHGNSEPSSQLNESAQTSKTVSSISQGEQQQETITISPQAQTSPQYTAVNIGTLSIPNGSPSSNTPHSGDGLKPDPKTLGGPLRFFLNKIVSPTAVASSSGNSTYY